MLWAAFGVTTFDSIKAAYPAALQFHVVTSPQLEKSLEKLRPRAIILSVFHYRIGVFDDWTQDLLRAETLEALGAIYRRENMEMHGVMLTFAS